MAHRFLACLLVGLAGLGGCVEGSRAGPGGGLLADGGAPTPSAYCDALAAGGIVLTDDAGKLVGAPLVFAPTSHGFGVSVVFGRQPRDAGPPCSRGRRRGLERGVRTRRRATDVAEWKVPSSPRASGTTTRSWMFRGGRIRAPRRQRRHPAVGRGLVQLRADLDTHIGASPLLRTRAIPSTLVRRERPSRRLAGFPGEPRRHPRLPPIRLQRAAARQATARQAYLNYRTTSADLRARAHFRVIGGWDGENGFDTADEIERSRSQRLLYAPAPGSPTYPAGGSPFEDYYAFTWGDALFVVLNVFTYTPTPSPLVGTRAARRLDARRRTARLASPDAGVRHLEVAVLVHPPPGRGTRPATQLGLRSGWRTAPPTSASRQSSIS